VGHLPGLSRRAEGQPREVSLIGCHAVKARMRMSLVVEAQMAAARTYTSSYFMVRHNRSTNTWTVLSTSYFQRDGGPRTPAIDLA
jgi:hypothetical protein